MATVYGGSGKGKLSNAGEETQDIDWENQPQHPLNGADRAKLGIKEQEHVPIDPWGESQLLPEETKVEAVTNEYDQDDGKDPWGSQAPTKNRNESNSNANTGGYGKKSSGPKKSQ